MNINPELNLPAPAASPDPALSQATTVAPEAPLPALPPVRIVGIGTAGLNILEALAGEQVEKNALIALHLDARALAASSAALKMHIEPAVSREAGLGGDPARGRAAAEAQLPRLKQICDQARVVVLVAGMGGAAGTGIAPVLAKAAREAGALVLAFVVLPFDCEGNLRVQVAQGGLEELLACADLVLCQPNQKAFALLDESTSLADTFKTPNQFLARSVSAAWQGLSCENLMGLPFADVCQLIRNRSVRCSLAVAETSGTDRVSDALEQLIAHPLLEGRAALSKAEAVAVLILSGPSLTMLEVNRLMDRIQKECGGAPVIMGTGVWNSLQDKLRVGLLVSQTEQPSAPPAESRNRLAEPAVACEPGEMDIPMVDRVTTVRPASRFVPPPPPATPEKLEKLRARKSSQRMRQAQLPLEIISKGRFEKSEPTIHRGEDLDIPTYIRRHVALN
ncbi:MAG TPA: hypothetical protein VN673_13090 [Clostridia bacterium]|nr:hypothetical protein [Clostridia bacterium]